MKEERIEDSVAEIKEKKKFKGIWVLILLVLIVGIGIGVFVPSLLKKEGTTKPVQEEEKDEIIELSEVDVSNYLEAIEHVNTYYLNQFPIETKNLKNQDILKYAWYLAVDYRDRKIDINSDFSKEQMKQFVSRFFGEDFTYQDEDIICPANDGPLFQFDGETYHRVGVHGHDGAGYYRFKNYFVGASRNETQDTMEIQLKVIYGDRCSGTCAGVQQYFKTPNGEVLYTRTEGDLLDHFDELYNQYKDELPITSYFYRKGDSGNYYLESVQIQ